MAVLDSKMYLADRINIHDPFVYLLVLVDGNTLRMASSFIARRLGSVSEPSLVTECGQ